MMVATSALLCLGTLALIDAICAQLIERSGIVTSTTILSSDLAKGQLNNRIALGPEKTSHGIFPEPPLSASSIPPTSVTGNAAYSVAGPKHHERESKDGKTPNSGLANSIHAWRKTTDGHDIYDVHYTTDFHGRRVTPVSPGVQKNNYLIFLGCSFTFGEGVNDNETLPYFVGKYSQKFRSYNYGIPGGSPGDAVFWLRKINQQSSLPEGKGWVVYVYFDGHLERMIGSLSQISTWAGYKSHYYFDDHDELKTDGRFQDLRAFQIKLYQAAMKSHIFQWLRLDWPVRTRDADWEFMAKTIALMKKDAVERLGARGFSVVFFPNASFTARRFIPFLESQGITYLDYSHWNMDQITGGQAWIRYDGHPSSKAYEILGQSVARELDRLDSQQ